MRLLSKLLKRYLTYMARNIYYIGDTHGDLRRIAGKIHNGAFAEGSILIHVGDVGLGFHELDRWLVNSLDDLLTNKNLRLLAIRGNHDDPAFFSTTGLLDRSGRVMVEEEFVNIDSIHGQHAPSSSATGFTKSLYLLHDYQSLLIDGRKFMFIGGAISVDRKHRVAQGSGYWEGEVISRISREALDRFSETYLTDTPLDVLVTHSAPMEFAPADDPEKGSDVVRHFAKVQNDLTLVQECLDERKYLSLVREVLSPKEWYYGHFHKSANSVYKGTEYRCLDIQETYHYERR